MKWFKHFSDARRNPKLRAMEREMGEAGYARAMKLYEIVAQIGGSGADFDPRIDLGKPTTNRDWLADEMGIDVQALDTTLHEMSKVGLIVARSLKHDVIAIPQMIEYRDEYASRKSGVTPDSVGSGSGTTPPSEVRGQKSDSDSETDSPRNQRDGASLRCASEFPDPFIYCGLQQTQMRMSQKFSERFDSFFKSYVAEISHTNADNGCTCSAEDFLENAMLELKAEGIRWPRALLARKKELEKLAL